MKPDIVFFGEGLPDVFHQTLEQDKLSVSSECVSLYTVHDVILRLRQAVECSSDTSIEINDNNLLYQ